MRQLLGLVVPLTASCIGDKDNRKQEVVVFVYQLSKRLSSSWNHRTTAKQDTVHIKEYSRLMETDVTKADRSESQQHHNAKLTERYVSFRAAEGELEPNTEGDITS